MQVADRVRTNVTASKQRVRVRAHATVSNPGPKPVAGAEIVLADPLNLRKHMSPYNPSPLIGRYGYRVISKMMMDEQIKAAVSLKELAVLASGWRIESPPDMDEDWEPTAFVRECLGGIKGRFARTAKGFLTAIPYGFSVAEKIWKADGRYLKYDRIPTKHPSSFDFKLDEYGNVVDLLQKLPNGQTNSLPQNKFVRWTYGTEFAGNPYGISDLEAAYRAWWSKDAAFRWMAIYLERFGIPPIFALYNSQAYTPQQVVDLEVVLATIAAGTSGVIPRDEVGNLEMWSPTIGSGQRITGLFVPAMDFYDKRIALALGLPGLIGMTPGDQNQGSLARANVHFDVFMLLVDFIRGDLSESVIQEQIVDPLVAFNFAIPKEQYPRFKFPPISPDERKMVFDLYNQLLMTGGIIKGPLDENAVREALRLPERAPQDVANDPKPEAPEGQEPDAEDEGDQADEDEGQEEVTEEEREEQNVLKHRLRPVRKTTSSYAGFNPDQLRDEDGQWTDGGGVSISDLSKKHTGKGLEKLGGKSTVTVYRVGDLDDRGRGIHFGESAASVAPYRGLHKNKNIKKYDVEAENIGIVKHHMDLHRTLFKGQTFQDAVWAEDKKSGFKDSIAATFRVEVKMARAARQLGFNALIYTAPPAPAKQELVVLNTRKVKITEVAKKNTQSRHRPKQHTHHDERVDYEAVAEQFAEIEQGARATLSDFFLSVREAWVDKVRRAQPPDPEWVLTGIASLPKKQMLRNALRGMMIHAMDEGMSAVKEELEPTAQKQHWQFVGDRDSVSVANMQWAEYAKAPVPNVRPKDAERYLKTKELWITGVVESDLVNDARRVLLNGLSKGTPMGEMLDQLYDAFEPWVDDPTRIRDGAVVEPHRLETIIRTNTTDAYNRGRVVQSRQAGKYLKGFQYSAILDDSTTEVCASLHGKVFSADDPALDELLPPRHFNCRSIVVPVTIDEAVEEDDWISKAEIGAAKQASGKGF